MQDILKRHAALIQYESDDSRPAVADSKMIRFNGIGEDGHETFLFRNAKVQDRYDFGPGRKSVSTSAFCKTARKPYDIVVCEVLLVLKRYMPNLAISSDGFAGCLKEPKLDGLWNEAIENVKQYGINYSVVVTEERGPYCDIEPKLAC